MTGSAPGKAQGSDPVGCPRTLEPLTVRCCARRELGGELYNAAVHRALRAAAELGALHAAGQRIHEP